MGCQLQQHASAASQAVLLDSLLLCHPPAPLMIHLKVFSIPSSSSESNRQGSHCMLPGAASQCCLNIMLWLRPRRRATECGEANASLTRCAAGPLGVIRKGTGRSGPHCTRPKGLTDRCITGAVCSAALGTGLGSCRGARAAGELRLLAALVGSEALSDSTHRCVVNEAGKCCFAGWLNLHTGTPGRQPHVGQCHQPGRIPAHLLCAANVSG